MKSGKTQLWLKDEIVYNIGRTPEQRALIHELYQRNVGFVDYNLGILIDWMRIYGMLKNTLIVVASDHGEEFWEHHGYEHGHSFHREVSNVVLVIRPPDAAELSRNKSGFRGQSEKSIHASTTRIVSLVDVFPTIMWLMDVEPPAISQGNNLFQLPSRIRTLFGENVLYGHDQHAVYSPHWTMISSPANEPALLYDAGNDPDEERNMASRFPDMLTQLDERYERHIEQCRKLTELLKKEAKGLPEKEELDEVTKNQLRALGYLQ
jgi:arylsulfatase A-like enzyme